MKPRRSLVASILTVLGAIVLGIIGLVLFIPAAIFFVMLVIL